MKSHALSAVAAALALGSGVASASLVIDAFTVGQAVAVDSTTGDGGVWSSSTAGHASILGGQRDFFVEKASGPGIVDALVDTTLGTFNFSQGTNTAGTALLRWDGANTTAAIDTTGLVSQNFTVLGTGVAITFKSDSLFIDPFTTPLVQEYQVKIQAWGTGGTAFTEISQTAYATFGNYVTDNILFAELGWSNLSFDWASVSALQISFNTTSTLAIDVDVSITSPQAAVPEPMGLALVGLGLFGIGAVRRRVAK